MFFGIELINIDASLYIIYRILCNIDTLHTFELLDYMFFMKNNEMCFMNFFYVNVYKQFCQ